ncbi:hypothetical protein BT69DRAFT_1348143, partial [Atractiella rhizophila]
MAYIPSLKQGTEESRRKTLISHPTGLQTPADESKFPTSTQFAAYAIVAEPPQADDPSLFPPISVPDNHSLAAFNDRPQTLRQPAPTFGTNIFGGGIHPVGPQPGFDHDTAVVQHFQHALHGPLQHSVPSPLSDLPSYYSHTPSSMLPPGSSRIDGSCMRHGRQREREQEAEFPNKRMWSDPAFPHSNRLPPEHEVSRSPSRGRASHHLLPPSTMNEGGDSLDAWERWRRSDLERRFLEASFKQQSQLQACAQSIDSHDHRGSQLRPAPTMSNMLLNLGLQMRPLQEPCIVQLSNGCILSPTMGHAQGQRATRDDVPQPASKSVTQGVPLGVGVFRGCNHPQAAYASIRSQSGLTPQEIMRKSNPPLLRPGHPPPHSRGTFPHPLPIANQTMESMPPNKPFPAMVMRNLHNPRSSSSNPPLNRREQFVTPAPHWNESPQNPGSPNTSCSQSFISLLNQKQGFPPIPLSPNNPRFPCVSRSPHPASSAIGGKTISSQSNKRENAQGQHTPLPSSSPSRPVRVRPPRTANPQEEMIRAINTVLPGVTLQQLTSTLTEFPVKHRDVEMAFKVVQEFHHNWDTEEKNRSILLYTASTSVLKLWWNSVMKGKQSVYMSGEAWNKSSLTCLPLLPVLPQANKPPPTQQQHRVLTAASILALPIELLD